MKIQDLTDCKEIDMSAVHGGATDAYLDFSSGPATVQPVLTLSSSMTLSCTVVQKT